MYSYVVTLLLVATLQVLSANAAYTYECYPNNSIAISGLPTIASMSYFAVQSDGTNCTVTGNPKAGTADVDGCSKDLPIYFTFSGYSDMLKNQIMGGPDVEILNITCNEIIGTGVAKKISNILGANISFVAEQDFNVTYAVTSELNVTSANVGDPVKWTIIFPLEYKLEITTCTAYPGKTSSGASTSIDLTSAWCTTVADLISNFTTNGANTEASAIIQAFKFYNYDDVFLTCDVIVCPPTSKSCDVSCGKRKKRSLKDDGISYHTSVGRVLHVTDPYSSDAIQLAAISLQLMTFLTLLVCLL